MLAIAFCLGTVIGLGRIGPDPEPWLCSGPADGIAAELASTASSFVARVIRRPVSMTQTTAAGLAGARTRTGLGQVRWEQAARLMTAWAATLPTAALVAAAVALGAVRARMKRFVRTLVQGPLGPQPAAVFGSLVEQLDATIEAARLVHEVVRG